MCPVLSAWPKSYDLYVKFRMEMMMKEPVDIGILPPRTISARAREYSGPRRLKYGASFGGNDIWKIHRNVFINQAEFTNLVLDDQIYFFDDNIRRSGAFEHAPTGSDENENEWYHTRIWKSRGINLEIIPIHCILESHGALSGDL